MALDKDQSIMALDYGEVRVGVSITSWASRLPRPLTTLINDEQLTDNLKDLIAQQKVDTLIVGYPRNSEGEETRQTKIAHEFMTSLKPLGLPIYSQDESLTSVRAEAELKARGVGYSKADVDALAATYILEDYLSENER